MGFFKDFKEDFADAVDEMIPGGSVDDEPASVDAGTIGNDLDVEGELSKLDGLLQQVSDKLENEEAAPVVAPVEANEPKKAEPIKKDKKEKKEIKMDTFATEPVRTEPAPMAAPAPASDENAVITSGMIITGDLESTGSIAVEGLINGNVKCNGKLTVTGSINGNSNSAEFFADAAKISGEVVTSGTVKIGVGSVVIGNITATSAVIAGAVKGDIDVQGPVVVDTSAVVMGNIKSRSVQINNGAVIEGFCSQAYAEVDVASVFGK